MKRWHLKRGHALLFIVLISGTLLLSGCGKGDTGAAGATGATGATGPAGSVTTTSESCDVCHTAGKIADIALKHPDPTALDVTLSNIILTNTGGTPVVSFHAATASGPVTDLTFANVRFYLADLIPANTPTATWGTWPSAYYERWAAESSSTVGATFDTANASNGDYTYTFATGFGSAAALAEAPEYQPTDDQRLLIRFTGYTDTNGDVLNNAVGFLDFVVPATGATAVALDSQRQFVTADACKKCHSPLFQQAGNHADSYLDTRACVICHSPLGHYGTLMQNDDAYLTALVHQIHDAIKGTKFDFSTVTYPQDIAKCVVCHTNSGLNLGTGDEIDHWKTNPSIEACGACHTTVDFSSGANHPGGTQSNGTCYVCHPATGHLNPAAGASVTEAHDTSATSALHPNPVNVPEFNVALSITPPANGTYYVAGEAPEVRVTLTDHATNLPVNSSIYTTSLDAAGVTGGGLNVASLYVYGPRAKSVPVLATGTITDPSFDSTTDTPVQGHDLFIPSTDPQVTTDSTGFGYQLLTIPTGMTAGTYMVRVRIADYGRVGTGNYHIESTAFTNIQIGTAVVENKVAGDACVDCHGTGTAPFHDERHAVVFDTDQCLSCHDQSGNYAIPIADRVHAIHSANSAGDLYNIVHSSTSRDWSDVTFPQNLSQVDANGNPLYSDPRCVACHTSGNTTYETNPFEMPCAGCHVGGSGVLDHMRQNGGPY